MELVILALIALCAFSIVAEEPRDGEHGGAPPTMRYTSRAQ